MATFLELARQVARESGTVAGAQPATVVGQTGRLLKIVEWTRDAWIAIQNSRPGWLFLRAEFSGETTAGQALYTAASWGLDDLAAWIDDPHATTLYRTTAGVADEGEIRALPWPLYRRAYQRGVQTPKRPTAFAVSPDNAFALGPAPDDAYTVRGEYRRTAQRLADNDDVPRGLPERFHDIIAWRALIELATFDEAPEAVQRAIGEYRARLQDLERDQLPGIETAAEPLA